jgi:hypothetical protein
VAAGSETAAWRTGVLESLAGVRRRHEPEMSMRQKHIEFARLQPVANPKKAGPCIEDQADFREEQTRGMSPRVGMISGGAKQEELHRKSV